MSVQTEISRWQYLSDEAKAGRLYLDESVAKTCRIAIDRQIEVYQSCLNGIADMAHVKGLGDFECGVELARLLGLKASDSGGDGDLETSIRDHIQVLSLMGETIRLSIDRLQQQDSSNAQDLDKV